MVEVGERQTHKFEGDKMEEMKNRNRVQATKPEQMKV